MMQYHFINLKKNEDMRLVIFSFLTMVIFSSCKKEDVPTPQPTPTTTTPTTTTYDTFLMVSESNEWYHSGAYTWYDNSKGDVAVGDVIIIGTDYMYTWSKRKYYFEGDTTISSKTYMKMYFDAVDSTHRNNVYEGNEAYTKYVAAMRQEGSKVYYLDNNMSTEVLYADMEAKEGEVLNYAFNSNDVRVESVTEISLGDHKIKKYLLTNEFYFFEGIGNIAGLFKGWGFAIHGDIYLDKFVHDGHVLYAKDYPYSK